MCYFIHVKIRITIDIHFGHNVKFFIFSLLTAYFILFFSSSSYAIEQQKIRMGYFEIKPHLYKNSGSEKPSGAAIEYFEEMSKEMGYQVEWVGPLAFPRMIIMGETGQIDGLMTLTDWAKDKFLYPNEPSFTVSSVFVFNANTPIKKINSIDDVKGYSVGWIPSAPASQFVIDHSDELDVVYSTKPNWIETYLTRLVAGRIDILHDLNEFTYSYVAETLGLSDKIKVIKLPEPSQNAYIVFSKETKHAEKLLKRYNEAAKKLSIDYNELIKKEFELIRKKKI